MVWGGEVVFCLTLILLIVIILYHVPIKRQKPHEQYEQGKFEELLTSNKLLTTIG